MKNSGWLVFCIFLISLSSCLIPSVHPLYTEDVIVMNPELEGRWEAPEEPEQSWNFEKRGNSYYLTYSDGHEAYFDIHLVNLDGQFFLDFYPVNVDRSWKSMIARSGASDMQMNQLLQSMLLPVHMFSRIEIQANQIKMWFFDPEWLEGLFEMRKVRIKHEIIKDEVNQSIYLITAESRELQKFIRKYADTEEAYVDFDDPLILKRSKT